MLSQHQQSLDSYNINEFNNSYEFNHGGPVFGESPVLVLPKSPAEFTQNHFQYSHNYLWNQVKTQSSHLNTSSNFDSASKLPKVSQCFNTPPALSSNFYCSSSSSNKQKRFLLDSSQPKPFNCISNVNNNHQPPNTNPHLDPLNFAKLFGNMKANNPQAQKSRKQESNGEIPNRQLNAQKLKKKLFGQNFDGNQQQNKAPIKSKISITNWYNIALYQQMKNQQNTPIFRPSQPSQDNIINNNSSNANKNKTNFSQSLISENSTKNNNNINNNISNLLKFQKQQAASDPTYKTQLCKNWQEFGSCRYSTKCRFAHGPHELLIKQNKHQNYKTKDCKKFQNGYCPYGFRCLFKHETRNECDLKRGKYQTALRYLGFKLFEMRRLDIFKKLTSNQRQKLERYNAVMDEQQYPEIELLQKSNIQHIQEVTGYSKLVEVAA